ncbi:MAG: single-stranded-DNA-specific exonuclease RecJ [Patescibacteria group bacterium]
MTKRWIILPKKSNDITEQLLLNRKISKNQWSSFLKPDFEGDLFDPFLMKGMKKAAERIYKAIKNKEIIGIFGDYDADGIPGTALLYELFCFLDLDSKIFIPTREEGYGLNRRGIDLFINQKAKLLITVDLGVRNISEISYAQKMGLDVIVLDHHETEKKLPEAIVIDPKQKGEKYPFRELAATGIVFKLIQGLGKKIPKISLNYLKWSLDLVAISTICDIVPLISENRIFAKFGLIVLQKTKRVGLQKLYQQAAIRPENIDTYSVGFQIGPRLNAPGRMDHANESFYLLVSKKSDEAVKLAQRLDSINRQRQNELERVLKEAREKVNLKKLHHKKVILVSGKAWPQGIVGLVAGKLMEEFARPVIVCEEKKEGLRGSARSIDAYNIVEALEESKEFLTRFGGHKKAAGLSLEIAHISNLYDKLLEIAESKLKNEDLIPKISVDFKLKSEDINLELLEKIRQFEPFGLGNPRPVFLVEKAAISQLRTVGKKNNHLKFKAEGIEAIGFDLGDWKSKLSDGDKIDLVFTLDEDNWDGTSKVQLKVLDIKK